MTQYDFVYFRKLLKDLSSRAQATIVLRAAMRVFPMLARLDSGEPAFAYWPAEKRAGNALFICRCFQTAAFASSLARPHKGAHAAAGYAATRAEAVRSVVCDAARAAADAAYGASSSDAAAAATFAAFAAEGYPDTAARAASAILGDMKGFARDQPGPVSQLLATPLWPGGPSEEVTALWQWLRSDLTQLGAGFEIWIDWYQDRLEGKPFAHEIEEQWALLSKERLDQSPAEINDYLRSLRDGALREKLKRIRAIFIGHGEVGKTSLIRALHGEDVVPGAEPMTKGVAIATAEVDGSQIHRLAAVDTLETDYKDDGLRVHFWDFGGQVMAHATHQFFLRSKCLYVIVLAGRAGRNSNEEAEYWLEHVRAFGDRAPVLLVGNKWDVMSVDLDLRTLKTKYPNIIDFFPLSCTQAKGTFRQRFEAFREEFIARLKDLGQEAERFTFAQFAVLKAIQAKAENEDFLPESGFDEICKANAIALSGPGGRDGLLDIFDKLGIVMHFARMPYLTDYVLNPRWLTYGVYSIMYSEEARAKGGRLAETDLIGILQTASPTIAAGRTFHYPRDRCRMIADAMIAFGVAYRLGDDSMVIPALLSPEQPQHDFDPRGAIAFRFDFGGFLPRHILPALIVEHFRNIATFRGAEVVWQNGVLLRPRRQQAQAFVRADYHTRTLDMLVKGTDAAVYLGVLRESVQRTLETMPLLPVEEKVELRPEMRAGASLSADGPIWISYGIVEGAQKRRRVSIDGPDGHEYLMDAVVAAMPVRPDLERSDVFLSYSHEDGADIERLADDLDRRHITAWYDAGLIAGQPYRDVLQARIETTRAVVVLWSEHAVRSKWVRAEADFADKHNKLICLYQPGLDLARIPMPFAANAHLIAASDMPGLLQALGLKGIKITAQP